MLTAGARIIQFVLPFFAAACFAQKSYDIYRVSSPVTIDGKLDEPAWQQAPTVGDFHFPWFQEGAKEQTVARILWDDENLYVSWRASDKHISAYERQRHGPVSKDDCVEIFIAPSAAKPNNYYTFEINAIGTMLNRARTDWWTGPPTWEPEGVRYRTTFHGQPKKDESSEDDHWMVEAAIPFRNFVRDAANTPPHGGDVWRLNLQRLGGKTNAQASTWSPLPEGVKSFHTPEAFGSVRFVSAAPPRRTSDAKALPAASETTQEGRSLYNRSCTSCHGQDGTVGDRAPALAATRRYLRTSQRDLFDAIKHGIPGTLMPASPLPDAEVSKIVSYILSLRATAVDTPVEGDVARGQRVFEAQGCGGCHSIEGRGGILGPDLSNVASERSVRFLHDALTQRKPQIPLGYRPVQIVTTSGKTIEGILRNENNFSLQVLGKDGALHLLSRDEVKQIEYRKESLMPSDYDQTLNAADFRDLLAFLSRRSRGRQ
jgi:cytochrome c oxidase cbb3-type subunit III